MCSIQALQFSSSEQIFEQNFAQNVHFIRMKVKMGILEIFKKVQIFFNIFLKIISLAF